MSATIIIAASLGYLGLLFAIAYFTDRYLSSDHPLMNNPYIYALSLGVYCTAWTFYGNVGRVSTHGLEYMTIYLGPCLMAPLWYFILRKIIIISKSQNINSIADFISARYGKSTFLGGLVALVSILGVVPYIALQLKAISFSFEQLGSQNEQLSSFLSQEVFYRDTAFYVAVLLAAFSILFGTRNAETTEKNYGLIAAIAFESVVKLFTFILLGLFVLYGVYDGPSALFGEAMENAEVAKLLTLQDDHYAAWTWFWMIILSMFASFLMPRQFHVAVVENTYARHVDKAIWFFPLYLFIINLFIFPIGIAGVLKFGALGVDADTFVLEFPIQYNQGWLTLLIFCGGLSAASSMVVLASLSLSIMASNNLLIPLALRSYLITDSKSEDISKRLVHIRRLIIVVILLLSYSYFIAIGQKDTLVNIGLISIAAVAQFGPILLGGLYWKGATRLGAISGLSVGFLIWIYTLPLPSLAESSLIPSSFIEEGLFGIFWLKPYALLGLEGMDPVAHSVFWSLLFNVFTYFFVSVYTRPTVIEQVQASLFVDIHKYVSGENETRIWRGTAALQDIQVLLNRFLGRRRTLQLLREYAGRSKKTLSQIKEADSLLIKEAEKWLAAVVGAASARLLFMSVVKEEALGIHELIDVLDETQQLISYSRALEQKSRDLEHASRELRAANRRLKEMDQLKNEFLTTVTHELRTPITSIRSLTKIMHDHEAMQPEKRKEFLGIVIKESERISRLINQVLDLEKMESGHATMHYTQVSLPTIVDQVLKGMQQLFLDKGIEVVTVFEQDLPTLRGDKDRLMQVVINLVSNARKFCPNKDGKITITINRKGQELIMKVIDNGKGISPEQLPYIFDKFTQFNDHKTGIRQGSGLGLSITWRIVRIHKGRIEVESEKGKGATFIVTLPIGESTEIN